METDWLEDLIAHQAVLEPVATLFPLSGKLPRLKLLAEAVRKVQKCDKVSFTYCMQQAFLLQRMVVRLRPATKLEITGSQNEFLLLTS
jgi:hypothetical protein